MSLILVRKTEEFAAIVCDELVRIEDQSGNLLELKNGHNKLLILRPDLVIGVTGILAVSGVLRSSLTKLFQENCTDPDFFGRMRDKITEELRSLFIAFSAVLSDVHLSDFIAVVLVCVDDERKMRCVCWSSASAPNFSAVEYDDDDFICLGDDKAASHAQFLLSLRNPYLGPSESLIELESVAREVAKKYPECVSPSGFSFLVCPKQTNVEAV